MGGNCSICRPINVDVTSKGKCYKTALIILTIIDIVLLILQIVYKNYMRLFSEVFALIPLILLSTLHHYMFAVLLLFFSLFNLVYDALFLALRLQNYILKIPDDEYLNEMVALTWIELADFIFNIVLIIISFLAFREFMAIAMGCLNNNEGFDNFSNEDEQPFNNVYNNNNNNNNNQRSDDERFPGHGTVVGGS